MATDSKLSDERLAEIAAIPDEAIDTSDIPEADADFLATHRPIARRKEAAVNELRALLNTKDHEAAHSRADDILCAVLTDLGYADVVKEYQAIMRWCA